MSRTKVDWLACSTNRRTGAFGIWGRPYEVSRRGRTADIDYSIGSWSTRVPKDQGCGFVAGASKSAL